MKPLPAIVTVVFLFSGCAHQRVRKVDGCWVQHSESRLGDTREMIAACEPRPPQWSSDPLTRSIEDCLYQAQIAWYHDAIRRSRAKKDLGPPPSFDAATERCIADSARIAQQKIERLNAELESERGVTARLAGDNKDLRDTLVKCVEKTPTAVAEASAHTQSTSDSANTGREVRVVRNVRTTTRERAPAAASTPATSTSAAGSPATPASAAPAAGGEPHRCPPVATGKGGATRL